MIGYARPLALTAAALPPPSILLTPVAVDKSNVATTVVKDAFWTKADICTAEFAAACAAAGIN
jgi:D-xylose transport system substrate-binding protein